MKKNINTTEYIHAYLESEKNPKKGNFYDNLNKIADHKKRKHEAKITAMGNEGDLCNLSMGEDDSEINVPWRDPKMAAEFPTFLSD